MQYKLIISYKCEMSCLNPYVHRIATKMFILLTRIEESDFYSISRECIVAPFFSEQCSVSTI
jgi:hypothetical protein